MSAVLEGDVTDITKVVNEFSGLSRGSKSKR